MKKVLVVLFSLLLVFLMVPVVSDAAYAADTPFKLEPASALASPEFVYTPGTEVQKIPGIAKSAPQGTREAAAPVELDSFAVAGFVDDSLPTEGWVSIDADGDGSSWLYACDYSFGFASLSGSDSDCAASASYDNIVGALEPDNWLVTPAVKVPENTQLHYFAKPQDTSWKSEHYAVLVSTTSQTDLSSFETVFEETVNYSNFTLKTVDLSEYAGQTVYIAFRHFECSDWFWLNLDQIGLSDKGSTPVANTEGRGSVGRVKGKNRYETSIQIAMRFLREAGYSGYPNAVIATGDSFADALAGSALSISEAAPIILISPKSQASIDAAIDFIYDYVNSSGTVYILGGEKAVPASVEDALDDIEVAHQRFSGKNRYDTNIEVLKFMGLAKEDTLLVCDGTNWPDAATASSAGSPMMLVGKNGLTDNQKAYLDEVGGDLYTYVIGGTAAVSDEVLNQFVPYTIAIMMDQIGGPYRIAGKNRAETAVALAEEMYYESTPDGYTFAYGLNFPDTIAGGFLSAYTGFPILYGDSAHPTTYVNADAPFVEDTGSTYAYILGGKSLIAGDFVADLIAANLD